MHRVLVVDDESALLFAYRKLIESENYVVDACDNLVEAMELVRTHPYLAIITDMRLEGTDNADGLELVEYIREMQPDAKVIIATGYGTEELKRITESLGAAHYFEKPVKPSVILEVLKVLSTTVIAACYFDVIDFC